jgi:hypothetical protein
MGGFE